MSNHSLTAGKAAVAISAGVIADIAQLPLTLGVLSGIFSIESEALDLLIDVFMGGLTMGLLGFHWALLPTCILEAIPVADAAPTWTACVSYVVWRRKQQGRFEPSSMSRNLGRRT